MTDREHLKWYILSAVSPFYENISGIESGVRTWSEEDGYSFTIVEVRSVLEELIASGLVNSWRLASNSPENARVNYDSDQIGKLWFLISSSGQELLESLDKKLRGSQT